MQQTQLESAIALYLKEAMFCHCSVAYKLFNFFFRFNSEEPKRYLGLSINWKKKNAAFAVLLRSLFYLAIHG